MIRDVEPGRAYRAALELVVQDRVQWLPGASGFRVVPTGSDPTPALDRWMLWDLFVAGLICPVRPGEIAGYRQARAVRLTAWGHAHLHLESGERDGRRSS